MRRTDRLKKLQRRGPAPSAPIGALAARAADALRQERFKEAVELFKLAIRQDPRSEWKELLADAYRGRARALAGKRMFKEAAMVLENTFAPDGTVRDPLLYLRCLIREGQHQKAAAHAVQYIGSESALPAAERVRLEELTAALLVAVPQRLDPARAAPRRPSGGGGWNLPRRPAMRWQPGSMAHRPRRWTGN